MNINIDAQRLSDNPGLRQVAKILLNSSWGKFGQRTNMKAFKFNNYNEFNECMNDKTIVPLSWDIIGKDIVEFGTPAI